MGEVKQVPIVRVEEKVEGGVRVKVRQQIGEQIYFERFTLSQRIQHMVLMLSFILLIMTGLPLLTTTSKFALFLKSIFSFPGSFELRGLLHRAAAVVLIALSAYHVLYSLLSTRGSRDIKEMVFRKKDLEDFLHFVKYNLGRTHEPPSYRRFNFIEKFEYMSVLWGTTIMILTGLMLWQEEATLAILPMWALHVAKVVHGYEAILAFLAIIIWHLYTVHLSPPFFPMNKVWLTGHFNEEEMRHHHRLEYEELMKHYSGPRE